MSWAIPEINGTPLSKDMGILPLPLPVLKKGEKKALITCFVVMLKKTWEILKLYIIWLPMIIPGKIGLFLAQKIGIPKLLTFGFGRDLQMRL